MMGPDDDLETLVGRRDHLNVLRSIRTNQQRVPELVVEHGLLLLGPKLEKKLSDESARLAALEQVAVAALDLQDHVLAELCLARMTESGTVAKDAVRFRMLLARCLEAAGEILTAQDIYRDVLKSHPANLQALRRQYCLAETPELRMAALNACLQQNASDSAAWYEMALLRQSLGDYRGASFALEEVVLANPLDPHIHVLLGETYGSLGGGDGGGLEHLALARKHMAQALELDPTNRRAMFGLVAVSKSFLKQAAATGGSSKKNAAAVDDHDIQVAKELVKYGAEQVLTTYKGSNKSMRGPVQTLMKEYLEGLL